MEDTAVRLKKGRMIGRYSMITYKNGGNETNKREFVLSIFFAILLFMIVLCIVQRQVEMEVGDHFVHGKAALEINRSNFLYKIKVDPHCLWHLIVKTICAVFKTNDLGFVAGIVSGTFVMATYYLTVIYMRGFCAYGYSVMAFIASVVGPLYVPWINKNYYLGTGSPNTWHNPTNIVVKPFAVVIFVVVCGLFSKIKEERNVENTTDLKISFRTVSFLSLIILFSVIAKPSFVMAFIPAVGVYIILLLVFTGRQNLTSYYVLCISFVPGVLILIYQYLAFFGDKTGAGIGIDWFHVVKNWTNHPFLSSMLALCFPVMFLLCNIKREILKTDVQLSLIYISISWLMGNLLFETGEREFHGNFSWAYLLSLYILWMVCLAHFLVDFWEIDIKEKTNRIKQGVLISILVFHILFGLIYIMDLLIKPGFKI